MYNKDIINGKLVYTCGILSAKNFSIFYNYLSSRAAPLRLVEVSDDIVVGMVAICLVFY